MQFWFSEALIGDQWQKDVRLTIQDGLIFEIEPNTKPLITDKCHEVGLPGLGNVHSHSFQRAMAGLSEYQSDPNDDFWSWRALMYQFLERLSLDDIEAIAALSFSEMLESGFTHVGEFHYLHNDAHGRPYDHLSESALAIIRAAHATGIGLTLLPVYYAQSDFGGAPPKPGQRRFIHDLDGFYTLLSQCQSALGPHDILGIAPHSLRAVTPEALKLLMDMRKSLNITGPIHIHAAEQVVEVEASLAFLKARPVEWLLNHHDVNENWCLIHATHVTDNEVSALAKSGAVAGLCPITEANLGDGIFPAQAYFQNNGFWAIGTDSNILIDAVGELRGLEYSQRLSLRARNRLAGSGHASVGRSLYSAALKGGSRALHSSHSLTIGAPANIVTLNKDHPALMEKNGDFLLDSWIFAQRTNPIDCVYVRGQLVVKDGDALGRELISQRYRKVLARISAQ